MKRLLVTGLLLASCTNQPPAAGTAATLPPGNFAPTAAPPTPPTASPSTLAPSAEPTGSPSPVPTASASPSALPFATQVHHAADFSIGYPAGWRVFQTDLDFEGVRTKVALGNGTEMSSSSQGVTVQEMDAGTTTSVSEAIAATKAITQPPRVWVREIANASGQTWGYQVRNVARNGVTETWTHGWVLKQKRLFAVNVFAKDDKLSDEQAQQVLDSFQLR